jgi:hypothetical protein
MRLSRRIPPVLSKWRPGSIALGIPVSLFIKLNPYIILAINDLPLMNRYHMTCVIVSLIL